MELLIVDDERIVRQGIRTIIERSEVFFFQIYECENGKDAISFLETHPVDLIITDIKMPFMDGLEFIERCIRLYLGLPPQFIILSGYQDFSFAQRAIKYGVRSYLLKPVGRMELLDTVRTVKQQLEE